MQSSNKWPDPLLQPDNKKDCMLYSTAYLCHCLNHSEVTVEQLRQYRKESGLRESSFPSERLSIQSDHWWNHESAVEYQRFWLGKKQREWVEQHLAERQIALVHVHRVPEMTHIVVLLESDETGVLIADPIYGHIHETWGWFLSDGASKHGCHRVEGWYKL